MAALDSRSASERVRAWAGRLPLPSGPGAAATLRAPNWACLAPEEENSSCCRSGLTLVRSILAHACGGDPRHLTGSHRRLHSPSAVAGPACACALRRFG
jgi:hypothetical protein